MAYEITATRKRPQNFDQIVGQEFIVATLKSSIGDGRTAHAYLFSGPRGVGKTSAARVLAKALNCEKGPTPEPCGRCTACTEITAGNSLDVIEIDGASNTSVNDVREIKDEVLFAPNGSRYKIYIIDEVHMLSNSAFNALLKTIEEPPPYIVFVFATTEVHKVPATIRSRCQHFNFRLISAPDIRDRLAEVVSEMGRTAEDEALLWIAREATGSLRDAYTLLDQTLSFSEDHITLERIKEKLGVVGRDELNEVVRQAVGGEVRRVLELTGEILQKGVAVEQFVIDLTEFFRDLLLIKAGLRGETVMGFSPETFPADVEQALSTDQIEKAIELLLELYRKIRYSLNQRFELELAMSRLSRLKNLITSEEILRRIEALRSGAGPRGVPPGGTSPGGDPPGDLPPGGTSPGGDPPRGIPPGGTPGPKPSGGPDESGPVLRDSAPADAPPQAVPPEVRDQVVDGLRRKKPTLASALERVSEWRLTAGLLHLVFEAKDRFHAEIARKQREAVAAPLSERLGRTVRVKVEYRREAASGQEAESEADREGMDQVEMVRKVFKGEIVKGE